MNLKLVNELIAVSVNVNQATRDGLTPLMIAAANGCNLIMDRLIQQGAQLNCKEEKNRETALIKAVKGSNFDEARILVNQGANVNVVDASGMTALDWALL
jgi:ankyrin repeat protein